MGFYDVSSSRTADTLFHVVSRSLEKFDYKSKLIAQCFDDASVMSGELNGLQSPAYCRFEFLPVYFVWMSVLLH